MISRRAYLKLAMAAGVTLAARPSLLWAEADRKLELITRPIPSSGERLPGIGLGSSATFSSTARSEDLDALREVLGALVKEGGTVFDTSPSYGASEAVAARIANEQGIANKLFWATKLNVAGRGGGKADPDQARAQLETSFERIGKDPIDLIQVHNMADIPTQLGMLKEYRAEGRVRYIGVTTTFPQQYQGLERVMEQEPIDFIGVDYAIDNRTMEERILPLARDKGIAVLIYAPFGRTRLWDKVRGKEVPGWAAEFDAHTWGQFFLKFVLAHPVVTAATPATSRARHMIDNMGAAMGRLPDDEMRQRMIAHMESL
ncbi:MAG: aldo/keto reductase [Marinobacter sp.]|uniref:aldo/keto reductase n=1 Tax=Marinobacter sp. TaxID=50741 RepID=UPI0029C3D4C0|nr:aldo/keto reductase [Marinobacter sp.]MDX5334790.1 aldo/keto reductase [Marinobacter sp.]MDX5385417.1 aldo/keto reductase [Marinobacter sp.]MDX5440719.1 aldo/keto reductase [Alteromonadaceae bacterium]MDX5471058.1 aldo/keto reductase [Marinobacter sp.]